jgi:hypothetical protein
MVILSHSVSVKELAHIEEIVFFDDWIKCVADIDQGLLAVNAAMHADLEELLLSQGSRQESLYGFNIFFDPFEIEYDSLINAPRNRAAGYPRDGRGVSDPAARARIEEIVKKWIQ